MPGKSAMTSLLVDLGRIALDNEKEFFWEPCNCGCPGEHAPKSKASVAAIRVVKAIQDLGKQPC